MPGLVRCVGRRAEHRASSLKHLATFGYLRYLRASSNRLPCLPSLPHSLARAVSLSLVLSLSFSLSLSLLTLWCSTQCPDANRSPGQNTPPATVSVDVSRKRGERHLLPPPAAIVCNFAGKCETGSCVSRLTRRKEEEEAAEEEDEESLQVLLHSTIDAPYAMSTTVLECAILIYSLSV